MVADFKQGTFMTAWRAFTISITLIALTAGCMASDSERWGPLEATLVSQEVQDPGNVTITLGFRNTGSAPLHDLAAFVNSFAGSMEGTESTRGTVRVPPGTPQEWAPGVFNHSHTVAGGAWWNVTLVINYSEEVHEERHHYSHWLVVQYREDDGRLRGWHWSLPCVDSTGAAYPGENCDSKGSLSRDAIQRNMEPYSERRVDEA